MTTATILEFPVKPMKQAQEETTTRKSKKESSVRLPPDIWAALKTDAERCHRSANQHLTALLDALYFNSDVNISARAVERMAEASTTAKIRKRA